jgi:hypothetical protein
MIYYSKYDYINILKDIQETLSILISEQYFNKKANYLDIIKYVDDHYLALHMCVFANKLKANATVQDALYEVEEILRYE